MDTIEFPSRFWLGEEVLFFLYKYEIWCLLAYLNLKEKARVGFEIANYHDFDPP